MSSFIIRIYMYCLITEQSFRMNQCQMRIIIRYPLEHITQYELWNCASLKIHSLSTAKREMVHVYCQVIGNAVLQQYWQDQSPNCPHTMIDHTYWRYTFIPRIPDNMDKVGIHV